MRCWDLCIQLQPVFLSSSRLCLVFAADKGISFSTPSEVFTLIKPVDSISVPYPISWVDEERDCSSWLEMYCSRKRSVRLTEIGERVRLSQTRRIRQDWYYLCRAVTISFI